MHCYRQASKPSAPRVVGGLRNLSYLSIGMGKAVEQFEFQSLDHRSAGRFVPWNNQLSAEWDLALARNAYFV